MSANSPELTGKQHRAAILLAEDELADETIASQVGVSVATLRRWKHLPAFATAVSAHIEALQADLSRYAIARKDRRMAAYQDRWDRMKRLIDARVQELAEDEVAGGDTGLLVKQVKVIGQGKSAMRIEEYAFDGGLESAMQHLEKQAAVEANQWTERKDVTSGGQSLVRQYVGIDPESV